jgi:hypothetical protein
MQLAECGLTAEGILQSVRERMRDARRNAA